MKTHFLLDHVNQYFFHFANSVDLTLPLKTDRGNDRRLCSLLSGEFATNDRTSTKLVFN